MDVNEFIEKERKEAEEERETTLARYKRKREQFETKKTLFDMMLNNFPEKTDTAEKLEKANGREVVAETNKFSYLKENVVKYDGKLKFDRNSHRINLDGWSIPLITDDTKIKSIIDATTGEVIFENKYIDQPSFIQTAILFGKEAGLAELKRAENQVEWSKNYANESYSKTIEALEKIPAWIEQGKKLIYPEKLDQWKQCVCSRAADLYHGSELVNALEIMEALDAGKDIKEVNKLVDEGHSGASFGMLCKIVVNFSKRGPEFVRNNEYAKEWEEYAAKIEKENNVFKQNEKSNIKK